MKEVQRQILSSQNVVDRVVGFFNPTAGLRRIAARQALNVAGGYWGGKKDRRFTSDWNPGGGDANTDTIWDLQKLRDRSRDANRNISIARGLRNVNLTYIVGSGLQHHCRPQWDALPTKTPEARTAWQRETERKFLAWCYSKECDVERRHNFFEMQRLVRGAQWDSGDVFVIQTSRRTQNSRYTLALQVIEADRVSNPNTMANSTSLIEGVELDEYGAAKAIYVSRFHPGALVPRSDRVWDRIEIEGPFGRRNVLQLADFERPGQVRGVPGIAPFLEQIKHVDDYRNSEQIAALVASWFTVGVTSETGEGLGGAVPGVAGSNPGGPTTSGSPKLGPGIITSFRPGSKVEIINPGRPNSNFGPFIQSIIEHIGMGADVPYEVYLKHYSSSFSASRAAQQEAFRAFRPRRESFAADFCHEVYCAWLTEAVALGDVIAPGYLEDPETRRAWQGDEWTGDAPISIDPLKEANAIKTRVEMGLTDLAQEIAEYSGRNFEDVIAQRAREREMLLAADLIQDPPAPGTDPSPGAPSSGDAPDNTDNTDDTEDN